MESWQQWVHLNQDNLLKGIDKKTVRREDIGQKEFLLCSLFSKRLFYKETKWYGIILHFFNILSPKNIFLHEKRRLFVKSSF